jgi:retron-type reverse transcriptase
MGHGRAGTMAATALGATPSPHGVCGRHGGDERCVTQGALVSSDRQVWSPSCDTRRRQGGQQGTHPSTWSPRAGGAEIRVSAGLAEARPGGGAGQTPPARGQRKRPWIAAGSGDAARRNRSGGGGRPRALRCVGKAGTRGGGADPVESALSERPTAGPAETVAPQAPHVSAGRPGKQRTVPSRRDKVSGRKHLARAGEKGQQNRGSAGLDEGTSAPVEAGQESDLDLRPRQLRDGPSRPTPGHRVEIPPAAGGVRTLGLPRVVARVGQQALVQRRDPSFAPTVLARAGGDRTGRAPQEAMRHVWRELQEGTVWRVEAGLRQVFATRDQAKRLALRAEERSAGRGLPLGRDLRRAGVMAAGRGRPPRTGVPQGGGASPRGSTSCLPPFDRRRAAEGCRLTRWADDVVGRCQTRAEAQRAWARAERRLRAARGVEWPPQQTRRVPVSPGVEVLGYQGQQGTGPRLPAAQRRRRAHPPPLDALPRETSGQRFREPSRARTRRQAALTRREVIARRHPGMRGWGPFSPTADVRRLCPRLDRGRAHRRSSLLAKRWRNPRGRRDPPRRLIAECGLVRLTPLIPGLVHR